MRYNVEETGAVKKIISGLFFRLIKGFEIWVMIALLIWSSAVMDQIFFANTAVSAYRDEYIVGVYHSDGKVSSETIVSKRFEYTGMSAYDLYRSECEPVLDTITDPNAYDAYYYHYPQEEMIFFCSNISTQIISPALLMVLFIPVFFGKLFSDGTLKNYIACGHNKGAIYFASLIFCFAVDVLMVFINFLIFAGWCIYYAWKPPIYLPVVLTLIVCSMLLLFTITSICLAILFACSKRTVPVIVGLILAPCLLFTNAPVILPFLAISNSQEIVLDESYDEYINIYQKNNQERKYLQPFLFKLELSDFTQHIYYEGKEIRIFADSNLNPVKKCALVTAIYLNPASVYQFTFNFEEMAMPPYMICRDGLAAINIACNILWISVSNGIALAVFRKREIAS